MFGRHSGKRRNLFEGLDPSRVYQASVRSVFASGVGRSGTHFMASLFEQHADIQAYHMDDIGDSVGDSFSFYSRWYGLPLDDAGLIQSRAYLMETCVKTGKRIYLESNPMLALNLVNLLQQFDSKIIVMIRHPKEVVESHYQKGWYRSVPNLTGETVPGYFYFYERPNHFFSRIFPVDPETRNKWTQTSRVGRLAWMWKAVNTRILEQLQLIDSARYRIVSLAGLDHNQYGLLCEFIGTSPQLTRAAYAKIVSTRPGKGTKITDSIWNAETISEYNREIREIIPRFNFLEEAEHWIL